MTQPPTWTEQITPGRFEGQTVIVTGAGSGIGKATALRIAREGGRVVASDIRKDRLDELVAGNGGLAFVPVAGDVSNEQDVSLLVQAAGATIDGLANVAGIMDDFTPVHEVSDEVWERVFRVNVTGIVRPMRAVIPRMLDAGSGSVVNITSEAGLRGSAAGVAYTASKHAVIGITRSSAVMYGPRGIRVNAVAPGATITNIEARFNSTMAQERLGPLMQAVIPKPARADELAASITFLLSRDGTNINGAILPSDGGWSAL
jgi:NAD(P)-dependent dehydrogenase (short-subunit alcohol dehydrogenase family)